MVSEGPHRGRKMSFMEQSREASYMSSKFQNQIRQLEDYFDHLPRREEPLILDRIKNLLEILGDPHKKLRGIHVGGTNGKGSVSAMSVSILRAAGYKVGLYTSPHLVSPCERIRIGNKNIPEKKLLIYLLKIKKIIRRDANIRMHANDTNKITEPPTWFEALTAAAILYFVDEKVDLAVFEVGLGGRGDATNVLNLGVEIITNVQMDHRDMLGNTLEKIAKEKAGIIKKNSYVLTGCSGKLLKIIKRKSRKEKVKLFVQDEDIKTKLTKLDNNFTYSHVITPLHEYRNLKISLLGLHQIKNAALAVAACEIFSKKGFRISEQDVKKGLKNIFWPARYQIVSKNPKIIIDGAHNPAGIEALVRTFKILEAGKKAVVLFAAKKTKDAKSMLKNLFPISGKMILVDLPESHLFHEAKKLKKYFAKTKIMPPNQAFFFAKKMAKEKKSPLLICGSIYFLGELIKSKILSP